MLDEKVLIAVLRNHLDHIKEKTEEKFSFEGVINVWNVDTFESGSNSKASFLESASMKFSKENKGVLFLVKNFKVYIKHFEAFLL